jgi:sigma-54 specific flagellar transcriptional regulator A
MLLLGGSGTGKELIARAIHELSARSSGPFHPVMSNCNCNTLEAAFSDDFRGC